MHTISAQCTAECQACKQAWSTVHLPKRGSWWQVPRVHAGFYSCWRTNGFDEAVKGRLARLIESGEVEASFRLLVTGELCNQPRALGYRAQNVLERTRGCMLRWSLLMLLMP